jgi:polysaccharide biosynthesis transport protein
MQNSNQISELQTVGDKRPLRPAPGTITTSQASRRSSDFAQFRVPGTAQMGTVLALIMRQRWPIVLTFLAVMSVTLAYTFLKPPAYEASLRIRLSGQNDQQPSAVDYATAEVEILKGRTLAEQLARQAGLLPANADAKQAAKVIEAFDERLKVVSLTGTNLIDVKYRDAKPQDASRILNLFGNLYLQKHEQVHERPATAGLFQDKLKQAEAELNAAREELNLFREASATPLLNEQRQASVRREAELQAAIEQTRGELSETKDRLDAVAAQLATQPAQIESARRNAASGSLADSLKAQLVQLQNQRAELVTKYDSSYKLVKQIDTQIATTRDALAKEQSFRVVERTEGLNPLHQSLAAEKLRLEATLAGVRARHSTLQNAFDKMHGKSAQLEEFAAQADELERKVKLAEETYTVFLKRSQEAEVTDLASRSAGLRASILEPAATPLAPVKNHRSFILALGFLVACFLAASVSVTVEYLGMAMPHAVAAARIVQASQIKIPLASPADAVALNRHRAEIAQPRVMKRIGIPVEPIPAEEKELES